MTGNATILLDPDQVVLYVFGITDPEMLLLGGHLAVTRFVRAKRRMAERLAERA